MLIFLILICINCLIGCITFYFKFKEISLATILTSFICGFIYPSFIVFEKFINFMDNLDEIKIIKRKDK